MALRLKGIQHVMADLIARIPTHNISTTHFGLTSREADDFYSWGKTTASAFFTDPNQQQYLNAFGQNVPAATWRPLDVYA